MKGGPTSGLGQRRALNTCFEDDQETNVGSFYP